MNGVRRNTDRWKSSIVDLLRRPANGTSVVGVLQFSRSRRFLILPAEIHFQCANRLSALQLAPGSDVRALGLHHPSLVKVTRQRDQSHFRAYCYSHNEEGLIHETFGAGGMGVARNSFSLLISSGTEKTSLVSQHKVSRLVPIMRGDLLHFVCGSSGSAKPDGWSMQLRRRLLKQPHNRTKRTLLPPLT